jgi:hypothetical protein
MSDERWAMRIMRIGHEDDEGDMMVMRRRNAQQT